MHCYPDLRDHLPFRDGNKDATAAKLRVPCLASSAQVNRKLYYCDIVDLTCLDFKKPQKRTPGSVYKVFRKV